MIHRALLGSMERFAGILIEHHAGRFPDWLAPTQAAVLPVADRHNEAAASLLAALQEAGVRARLDDRSESVGRKIRDAELAKVPYMLVLGDREAEAGGAAVRSHEDGDLGVLGADQIIARGSPNGRYAGAVGSLSRVYTPGRCNSARPRRAPERRCLHFVCPASLVPTPLR